MITKSGDLTWWLQAAYDNFVSDTGDPVFQFLLEAYSLSISSVSEVSGSGYAPVSEVDAIVCGDTIIKAWVVDPWAQGGGLHIATLADEDAADQTWTEQILIDVNLDETVPPSLAVDGNTARVFYYDGTSIEYFESADKGATWGASQSVQAINNCTFIAATTLTRVHYMYETAEHNLLLGVLNYAAAVWTATDSDIYWPFRPGSFDAITGNQLDDGAASDNDIIAFTTDFPPLIAMRVDGTETVRFYERVQGIAVIRYQNGRWSDHYEFDVVDNQPTIPARTNLRLSKYGEFMFMTYLRVDGTENYPHNSLALSRSRTGLDWEMPYLMPSSVVGTAAVLLKRGIYAYLVDSTGKKMRSYSCGYVGDPYIIHDLSDYCLSVDTRMGDLKEVSITLGNPNGVHNDIFDDEIMWQMRVKQGYHIDASDYIIDTAVADLYEISRDRNIPTDHLVLTGRCELGRTTSLRADTVQERESHQIGGDDFESMDGTKWSGLRHTAAFVGYYEAENNILYLKPTANQGVAFTTLVSEVWNGAVQSGIYVAGTDAQDYAGVIFRGYDLYNFWFAAYRADTDKIILAERVDNVDTVIASVSNMGWSFGTWYYIKVVFRYNYIKVYSSTDGKTWTERIAFQIDGTPSTADWTTFGGISVMSGSMGYCGYGYSEEETYYPDPPDPPPPPVVDPVWPSIVMVATQGGTGKVGGIYLTEDFTEPGGTMPTWTAANTGLPDGAGEPDIRLLGVDTFHRAYRQYCLTEDGRELYVRTTSDLGGDGSWSLILNRSMIIDQFTGDFALAQILYFDTDPQNDGHIYVLFQHTTGAARVPFVAKSTDYGATWENMGQVKYDEAGSLFYRICSIHAYGGKVFVLVNRSYTPWGVCIYYSDDGAANWVDRSERVGNYRGTYDTLGNFNHTEPDILHMQAYEVTHPIEFTQYDLWLWQNVGSGVDTFECGHDAITGLRLGVNRPDFICYDRSVAANAKMIKLGDPTTVPARMAKYYITTLRFKTLTNGIADFSNWNVMCYASEGGTSWVNDADDSMLIYGANNCDHSHASTTRHHILAADTTVDHTTTSGKAGSNVTNGPAYTDSIPYAAGGVSWRGIQVLK